MKKLINPIKIALLIEFTFFMLIAMLNYADGGRRLTRGEWQVIIIIFIIAFPLIVKSYYDIEKH